MTNQFGLKPKIISDIQSVFTSFPEIEAAVLYGSRAKGNFKNGSDIDLTLKTQKPGSLPLIKIALALDELDLPYTFDLSAYDKINNTDLIEHINRAGIIFYQKAQA